MNSAGTEPAGNVLFRERGFPGRREFCGNVHLLTRLHGASDRKFEQALLYALLNGPNTVLSRGCVVWGGRASIVMFSCLAHSKRPSVSWEPWSSRMSSCGRSGPQCHTNTFQNHSSPSSSFIHAHALVSNCCLDKPKPFAALSVTVCNIWFSVETSSTGFFSSGCTLPETRSCCVDFRNPYLSAANLKDQLWQI